jgi:trans-aconitate 2-methyltransferase
MQWNPDQYTLFKKERFAPFFDLLNWIEKKADLEVVDLGCGTGELTQQLADHLPNSSVLGVDSSPEMLSKSIPFVSKNLSFARRSIQEQLAQPEQWDLIFSNAALQWIDDHHILIPTIISKLKPGGQLAIQIPAQNDNVLNLMILELANEEPFAAALGNWKRESPVLSLDEYAQLLFDNGSRKQEVMQKVYPIIANQPNDLFEFISGSTLIPYLERLNGQVREEFIAEFKSRIAKITKRLPALYSFKRNILYATY